MMAVLKKQKADAETKRFWESAEQAAREVANWPAWKRLEQDQLAIQTAGATSHPNGHHGAPDSD
jgi:hypothetical protein